MSGGGSDLFDREAIPQPGHGQGVRSAMRMLAAQINAGLLASDQLAQAITFATTVRDSETSSERDRLRASELLLAIANSGLKAAEYVDKTERLAAGEATERTVFEVKPPRTLGGGNA